MNAYPIQCLLIELLSFDFLIEIIIWKLPFCFNSFHFYLGVSEPLDNTWLYKCCILQDNVFLAPSKPTRLRAFAFPHSVRMFVRLFTFDKHLFVLAIFMRSLFSPQKTNLAEGYCYPPVRPSVRPSVRLSVC